MKRFIAAAVLAGLILRLSLGCTAFCICTDSGNFLAKNLDWPVDAGLILLNRSGIRNSSFPAAGNTVTWISRYKSLTFNQFGVEFPLGGMNEKGLVVEELNMPPVRTGPGLSKQSLNEFQLVQYILDNFSTVGEVEKAMMNFITVPLLVSLHYLIMDREGQSLILEFNGTRFNTFHGRETGFPVLSNNLYQESMSYLRNFQGFGGKMEVVQRPGSNERFVTVAGMLSGDTSGTPITRSKQILKAVSQPDTRWSLIYDAIRLTVHLQFHGYPDWKELPLDELFQRDAGCMLGADISENRLNLSAWFHPITPEENRALLCRVYDGLSREMDLGSKKLLFDQLCTHGNRFLDNQKFKK